MGNQPRHLLTDKYCMMKGQAIINRISYIVNRKSLSSARVWTSSYTTN